MTSYLCSSGLGSFKQTLEAVSAPPPKGNTFHFIKDNSVFISALLFLSQSHLVTPQQECVFNLLKM